MTETALRVGVVGLGFGYHLATTLRTMPAFHLAAVADRSERRPLEKLAADLGVPGYRSADEMIEAESLDAVVLALPPHTRDELLALCVERGVAVFLEKPLAGTPEAADRLVVIAAGAKRPVMMGFSFRFHPAVVKARALLDGQLGEPLLMRGQYVFNWQPPPTSWLWDPQTGGGLINENSCHLLDVVRHLAGEPSEVYAVGHATAGSPGVNAVTLSLQFSEGAAAVITLGGVGTSASRDFPQLEVYTTKGRLELRGQDHTWVGLRHESRDATSSQHVACPPERISRTRYTDAFEHFAHCIRTGERPSATVEQGAWAVKFAHACYRSMAEGKPIELKANS